MCGDSGGMFSRTALAGHVCGCLSGHWQPRHGFRIALRHSRRVILADCVVAASTPTAPAYMQREVGRPRPPLTPHKNYNQPSIHLTVAWRRAHPCAGFACAKGASMRLEFCLRKTLDDGYGSSRCDVSLLGLPRGLVLWLYCKT